MLFVISAPSGAGKTTIINEIRKQQPELTFSVSATTRPKRCTEIEGKDYYFITNEKFKKMIENHEFAEWEIVHGHFYGTLICELNRAKSEDVKMLLDVDVKGALSIKKLYPETITVFIDVPEDEIMRRLNKRNTETADDLKSRYERIKLEMTYKDKFDYIVENETSHTGLEKAVKSILKIINNKQ